MRGGHTCRDAAPRAPSFASVFSLRSGRTTSPHCGGRRGRPNGRAGGEWCVMVPLSRICSQGLGIDLTNTCRARNSTGCYCCHWDRGGPGRADDTPPREHPRTQLDLDGDIDRAERALDPSLGRVPRGLPPHPPTQRWTTTTTTAAASSREGERGLEPSFDTRDTGEARRRLVLPLSRDRQCGFV